MGPLEKTTANYLELFKNTDTIIACATPSTTPMGISVIRMSGSFESKHFNKVFSIGGPMGPLIPRMATLVKIHDFATARVVDNAIATFFPAPHSFTGESVLELSIHGNPRLVEKIIDIFVVNYNLRLAEAGEFTLRALKNKKLNLTQVEGLDLLLHATTQPLIELSQYMLSGGLQNEFILLKNAFDQHQAAIDILTDFSEDIGDADGYGNLHSSWFKIETLINNFFARSSVPLDHLIKPTVVLYGPPNAGKSTLFNLLLGFKRSIVSDAAGTTRDYIKESFFYKHNEFVLIDTAGIRETDNQIESEGINFTHKNLRDSYARLLVYSVVDFSLEDFKHFCQIGSPTHVVFTHCDIENMPCNISKLAVTGAVVLHTDLLNGKFSPEVLGELFLTDLNRYFLTKPLVSERQRIEINKLHVLSDSYSSLLKSEYNTDLAVLSSEFIAFRASAYNLIGVVNVDEILDYVFANFCIGK